MIWYNYLYISYIILSIFIYGNPSRYYDSVSRKHRSAKNIVNSLLSSIVNWRVFPKTHRNWSSTLNPSSSTCSPTRSFITKCFLNWPPPAHPERQRSPDRAQSLHGRGILWEYRTLRVYMKDFDIVLYCVRGNSKKEHLFIQWWIYESSWVYFIFIFILD